VRGPLVLLIVAAQLQGRIGNREASELLSVDEIAVNDLLPGVYEGPVAPKVGL